ncbi:hypothetical protein ILYODFUR_008709 [Ilyodon furcidens]|uniref:Uncharacterized protein n=1 Tax=Ilyodon furcidens TaxID=33524 RepID=A0ABV0TTC2_9TELE
MDSCYSLSSLKSRVLLKRELQWRKFQEPPGDKGKVPVAAYALFHLSLKLEQDYEVLFLKSSCNPRVESSIPDSSCHKLMSPWASFPVFAEEKHLRGKFLPPTSSTVEKICST